MPEPERMKKFVDSLTKKIEENKVGDIPSLELRLGRKLVETQDEARRTVENLQRTQDTIYQAQQRVEELHRQHLELSAKASGILESLLTLKFGDEIEKEKEGAAKEAIPSKGNGSKDPSKPKRSKKKRNN